MRTRFLLIVLGFFLFSPVQGIAAEEQAEEQETIEERLDRLQQELDQLRKEHEAEIKALNEKLAAQEEANAREGEAHRAAPVGSYGGIMNPSISAIADVQARSITFKQRREPESEQDSRETRGVCLSGISVSRDPGRHHPGPGDGIHRGRGERGDRSRGGLPDRLSDSLPGGVRSPGAAARSQVHEFRAPEPDPSPSLALSPTRPSCSRAFWALTTGTTTGCRES